MTVGWSSSGGVAMCSSGFLDGVMFLYYGPNSGKSLPPQRHCNVINTLTPLLHGIGYVLSYTTAGSKSIDQS